jgi:hypothetical protein
MQRTFFTLFTVLSLNCFGQEWMDYTFDENLTIKIPENYVIIDTVGQHIVRAQIDNALIMIQRISNKGEHAVNISNKADLIESYEGFQKGFMNSQDVKLLKQNVEERDGLQVCQFSCSATMGEERQIRHILVAFLNEHWYAIQFWEVEALSNDLRSERMKLFSSVRFAFGLSLENQLSYSLEASQSYRLGYLLGKYIWFLLLAGGVVGLIIWLARRGR